MSITAEAYVPADRPRGGLFARLLAPFVGMRQAYADTERAVAASLLQHDDATLYALGYRRADLKAGIVRSSRAV